MDYRQRIDRHLDAMRLFNMATTREALEAYGRARAEAARRMRSNPKPDARAQRFAYVQAARAFYALARRATR